MEIYKCPKCGSGDVAMLVLSDGNVRYECKNCLEIWRPEAVAKNATTTVAPLPCVWDDGMEIAAHWTVKMCFEKMDEERREFEAELFSVFGLYTFCGGCESMSDATRRRILDEWADMQIANTSAITAILGASMEELNEAIRRGNEHNRERGRL